MTDNLAILNFTGVYESESFYHSDKGSYLCVDLKGISGTNCFCDDLARVEIGKRITESGISFDGIHFIDNGNYHYMSAIMLEQVKEPFSLVVLDHHPDMQPPMFGDILSCGGWVLDVIEKSEYVCDIHVIGADRGLISGLDKKIQERAIFYDLEDVFLKGDFGGSEGCDEHLGIKLPSTEYPVYLSIDKDVLSKDVIITNWDQGDMTASQMFAFTTALLTEKKVLGIDVCGECSLDQEGISVSDAIIDNDEFNRKLLEVIYKKNR